MSAALRATRPEHDDRALGDTELVVVTFADLTDLDRYRQRRPGAFPILRDPDRSTYRAYGLERGRFFAVWGPAMFRRYWQILRPSGPGRGRTDLERATDDTRQLGGDFVIDADGRLVWAHWSTGPADRPTVDELVTAVRHAQHPPTTATPT